ncbi:zinc ribbon domain-containing protein [Parasegetibacter sp. NRK P23]|uniref:zinc ribbon domain-containing protein n=1 Tax=Parasegetibacter sp. NRK P23 TaxID=2942999 RepID=UPI0020449636|nr:C4-type zinc ribbon domain-containing protein [Parasegetibacter sp. NRK P23]MCM5529036.1 C4-type zinc ribbon domain-containing protein [Parasegetibacter sp. NRK P23]
MATVKEFSVEEKLASLITLQKIESKLDEIKILKGELPMEVSDLEDEVQGLHARQNRIEEEINGIQEFINTKKNAITEADALIQKYEKQSANVKNSREFEAINKEIEMQQLEMKLAEKHIRDANEEVADKARLLEAAKKQIANKENTLKHKKEELDKIIASTEKEETAFSTSSNAAREKVDPRLLHSYDRIRKNYRNGLAVVPVLRDACGGCYNAIPPQRQSEIRQHKKIIVCENCGRILVDSDLNDSVEV